MPEQDDLMNDINEMVLDEAAVTAEAPQRSASVQLRGRAEEIFRGMWASVFYSGAVQRKMILLTSAARGEGVSTIAAGMALSGSEGGARVALVDFNLHRPGLHEMLKLRQGPGIAEILAEGQPLTAVTQRVNASLDVITSGKIGQRLLEILRDEQALRTFLKTLDENYDYVLADCAAVNHYPDAQILGSIMKNVAIVVHTDITPREALAQAKKRVESGGGKVIGVILNMRSYPIPNFLYRRV